MGIEQILDNIASEESSGVIKMLIFLNEKLQENIIGERIQVEKFRQSIYELNNECQKLRESNIDRINDIDFYNQKQLNDSETIKAMKEKIHYLEERLKLYEEEEKGFDNDNNK